MVYYRKYRPQTILELDLKSVREKLTAILSSKEIPHAFLFTGSKGLGKTSSARILAKAINCTGREQGIGDSAEDKKKKQLNPIPKTLNPDIEPCNKCDACISITNGSNIDVLEIDAASNGGVEEIRTLRERVKFASSTLKKKVYIIDEVHMLSTGAFNALLKTLEEPPSHVVFVLATTELWKLPATIVSRTFQVEFQKPTEEELTHSLQRIVEGEKLKVGEGVLHEVFVLAEGSFRDGAKILEELALNSKKGNITLDLVNQTYKTGSISSQVYELLKAYSNRDSKTSLEVIQKLAESGCDFKVVIERIVDHLRGLLMLRNQIISEEKDIPELTVRNIKELLELANEAYGQLRFSVIAQLPLELMTIKYCVIDKAEGIGDRGDGLAKNREEGIGDRGKIKEEKTEHGIEVYVKKDEAAEESTSSNIHQRPLEDLLHQLVDIVNQTNKPAAALLRSCRDAVLTDDMVTISTPFPIHGDRLKSDRVFFDLEKAAEELFGRRVEVVIKVLPN